jgi:uncharacterized FlaG/YvyC family protein
MHNSISKKLLAGALSVMMVLSLVAPTGAQAASKYTLTNKTTVKAGTNYKYQLKGVSKKQYVKVVRNVSGETVKYNKKAVKKNTKINGTGKTLNLIVKFSEKNKNYTGKFTVKIYNKKTNKVAKSIVEKVTVKSQAKVAVKSVALDNTTPKVGDTIKATVEPANASKVTYAWYMGDAADATATVIEGATTSTITVTDAMVGKFIKVQVTGVNESTANATTTAAVQAGEAAELTITAEQTGAAKFTIKSNKPVASTDKITVTRGSSERTFTAAYSDDGLTTVLTMDAAIGAAEYTIKVAPADTKKAAAEAKVNGVAATLDSIDFVGTNLILTDSTYAAASVKIFGYNNFKEEVKLASLTPYTSKGSAEYKPSTNSIVITTGATAPFTTGEQVTVTAVYQDGTTVKQVSKALTISAASTVAELTFGELKSSNKALKDARVTLENMDGGTYYKEVTAKDQYGNVLTAKELTTALGTATKPGTFFITPNQAEGSYVYITGFDTDDKGNVIVKYDLGGLNMPGKQVFTYTGVGGVNTTDEVEVVDNNYIKKFNVSVPEMYQGKEAELTVTAVNQYDEAIDLYEYVKKSDSKTGVSTFVFEDKNHLTQGTSEISVPANVTLRVDKNSTKKTVAFYVTYTGTVTANTTAAMVWKPADASNTQNVTLTVQPAGVPAQIKTTNGTIKNGASYNFAKKLVFLDNYGASITDAASKPVFSATALSADSAMGSTYMYDIVDKAGQIGSTTVSPNATTKYTVTLWKKATTAEAKNTQLDQKIVTVTVASADYKKFQAVTDPDEGLLYTDGIDKASIYVYATDASGNTVQLDPAEYTVIADNEAVVTGNKIKVTKPLMTTAGVEKNAGKIKATVYYKGEEVDTVEVEYSNEKPVPTAAFWIKEDSNEVTSAAKSDIQLDSTTKTNNKYTLYKVDGKTPATDNSTVDRNAGVLVLTDGSNNYYLGIEDQYANNVVASFTKDGKPLSTTANTQATNGAYKVQAGTISYTFTASGSEDDAVASATAITAAADANKSVTFTIYGVTADGNITLGGTTFTNATVVSGNGVAAIEGGNVITYDYKGDGKTSENVVIKATVSSSPAGKAPRWEDVSTSIQGKAFETAITTLSKTSLTIETDGGSANFEVVDQYGFKVAGSTAGEVTKVSVPDGQGTGATVPTVSNSSGVFTVTAGGDANSNGTFTFEVDLDGAGAGTDKVKVTVVITGQAD